MATLLAKIGNFLAIGIWRIRPAELSSVKSLLVRQLRVLVLAVREFDEDHCQLRASALTFYALLSIVPITAMGFGIAKGFGSQDRLEAQLLAAFPEQEEVVSKVIEFANGMLESTSGGVIAGIGLVVLFWTVIRVLGNIERSFNDIWGVKKARTFGRKLGDYLSVMLVAPVLIIASSGVTVFINSQLEDIMEGSRIFQIAGTVLTWGLNFLPYVILWALFTFIYVFVPNLKVNFKSALVAGVIAGTMYQLVQWGYVRFQIGVSKYNAIYGSFAALPLFLVWLQVSWTVVLFGAELAFAHQNVETFEFEPDVKGASPTLRKLIALRIVHLCVRMFVEGGEPRVASDIAKELNVPARLVRDLVNQLVESRVLSETPGRGIREPGYQPARDVASLSVASVLASLDDFGTSELTGGDSAEISRLSASLSSFRETCEASEGNLLLRDL